MPSRTSGGSSRVPPRGKENLTVGWRGTEAHFLKLLRENLNLTVAPSTLVVAGTKVAAKTICDSFNLQGIRISSTQAEGGFTDFVLGHEVEKFLKD